MRVELDLPNPDGRLFSGMAATVSIALDAKKDAMSIPSTCVLDEKLVGKVLHSVCVVRDGRAQRVRVELGVRAGQRVEILKGLAFTDQVIVQPAGLSDGAAVTLSASKEKD
jgi:multidrug efflux pump subunit AcrA (membrane-fusion protein)